MTILDKAGHAVEIIQAVDLSEYYCVVIVSGDGLVYEVRLY